MNESSISINLDNFGPVLSTIQLTQDERQQRILAGGLVLGVPEGSRKAAIEKLHDITKLSKRRIKKGMAEVRKAVQANASGDLQALDRFIYNDFDGTSVPSQVQTAEPTSPAQSPDKEVPSQIQGAEPASPAQSPDKEVPSQIQGAEPASPEQSQDSEGNTTLENGTAQPKPKSEVFPNLRPPKKRGRKQIHPKKKKKRVRKPGAGRPNYRECYPTLEDDVIHIVEHHYAGLPTDCNKKWVSLSLEHIREMLLEMKDENGNPKYPKKLSCTTIGKALKMAGFSLQRNKKFTPSIEGHPDREKQFDNINRVRNAFSLVNIRNNLILEFRNPGHILRLSESAEKAMAAIGEFDDVDPSVKGIFDIKKTDDNRGYTVLGRIFKRKKEAKAELKKYNKAVKAKKTYELCRYIEEEIKSGRAHAQSIDAKKTENIGMFSNSGGENRPIGDPLRTLDHDYIITWKDDESGKIIPFGIYDIFGNKGYVVLGRTHDTAQFAVNSLIKYWRHLKETTHKTLTTVFLLCDGGGCNASRSKLWKYELIRAASELGLTLFVMHYPPGTSKYNPIEHRLFSMISKNWRGMPLWSVGIAMKLISGTKTKTGLEVHCEVDDAEYETGLSFSRKQCAMIDELIHPFSDCEQWCYIVDGRTIEKADFERIGAPISAADKNDAENGEAAGDGAKADDGAKAKDGVKEDGDTNADDVTKTVEVKMTQKPAKGKSNKGRASKGKSGNGKSTKGRASKGKSTKERTPKGETSKERTTQGETSKEEPTKERTPKGEVPEEVSTKERATQGETFKEEPTRGETSKEEPTKERTLKGEVPEEVSTKERATQGETFKDEPTKERTSKGDTPIEDPTGGRAPKGEPANGTFVDKEGVKAA